jgi:SAM-dependent methyltransferase
VLARCLTDPNNASFVPASLYGTLAGGARARADVHPGSTQGFCISRERLVLPKKEQEGADQSEHDAACQRIVGKRGWLIPLYQDSGAGEWGEMVGLFKAHALASVGFVVVQKVEYLFAIPPAAGAEAFSEQAIHAKMQVPRVMDVPALLHFLIRTEVTRRVSALVLVSDGGSEGTMVPADVMAAISETKPDVATGAKSSAPAVVKLVHVARHTEDIVANVLQQLTHRGADSSADGEVAAEATVFCVVVPRLGVAGAVASLASGKVAASMHGAMEHLRVLLALCQEAALLPQVAFDCRHAADAAQYPLLDAATTPFKLENAVEGATTLWSDKTHQSNVFVAAAPPSPVPFYWTPVDFEEAITVRRLISRSLGLHKADGLPKPPAKVRVSRSTFAEHIEQVATTTAPPYVATPNVQGAPVMVVVVPQQQGQRMYMVSAGNRNVCALPPIAWTGMPPPTGGVSLLQGTLAATHHFHAQHAQCHHKVVVNDVIMWNGEVLGHMTLSQRMSKVALCLDSAKQYTFRSPCGIAVVTAHYVAASDAYDQLVRKQAPSDSSVDYDAVGVLLMPTGAAISKEHALVWQPPESLTVTFVAGDVSTVDSDVHRVALSVPLHYTDVRTPEGAVAAPALIAAATASYNEEYCEFLADNVPVAVEVGDAVQLLLRRDDADGSHWWEMLRVVKPAELVAMASGLTGPAASAGGFFNTILATRKKATEAVNDPMVNEAEFALLLRAAESVCHICCEVTDQGHVYDGDHKYYCAQCWGFAGVGDCGNCGTHNARGHKDGGGDRFFCAACWTLFASKKEVLDVAETLAVDKGFAATADGAPLAVQCALRIGEMQILREVASATPCRNVLDLCVGRGAHVEWWGKHRAKAKYCACDAKGSVVELAQQRGAGRAHHRFVCADCFAPNFWHDVRGNSSSGKNGVPAEDGRPGALFTTITCLKPLPLHRALREEGAARALLEHAAAALAPEGTLVVALLDVPADDAKVANATFRMDVAREAQRVRLSVINRHGAAGHEEFADCADVPLVSIKAFVDDAIKAGFELLFSKTAPEAASAVGQGLSVVSEADGKRVDAAWRGGKHQAGGVTESDRDLLALTRFVALRRAGAAVQVPGANGTMNEAASAAALADAQARHASA